MPDLSAFANVWEHARLLSDAPRNQAYLALLQRHAKDNRVLEIGCGTGLLSCIAAKLGASHVIGVEPTAVSEVARELVAHNGLGDRVEILDGRLEDLEPRPVDLAFSELLNADPFFEGIIPVSNAAAPWIAEGGLLAPARLKVYAALVRGADCAREVRQAKRCLAGFADQFQLNLGPLVDAMETDESYRFMSQNHRPVSEPMLLYDLTLGENTDPEEERIVQAQVTEAGPVDGAIVWFECTLDEGIVLHNRPGTDNHWGQLVCGWSSEVGARAGAAFELCVEVEDDELDIRPAS